MGLKPVCMDCRGETVDVQICPKCHTRERAELARLKGLGEVTQQILIQTSVLTAQSLFALASNHGRICLLSEASNTSNKLTGLLAAMDALSKESK